MANELAAADQPRTTLPNSDDWASWIDILTRVDTGHIDCVPPCLRHLVDNQVGPDGRLTCPNLIPSTPYGVAKFMLMMHPIPWRGTGLRPDDIAPLLAEGMTGEEILALVALPDDGDEIVDLQRGALPSASDLYMIRSEGGPIKIGVSAEPEKRLKALQTGHPYKLQIACRVPGGAKLETAYHRRFAKHRLNGEWFSPHPDILAEIERLSAQLRSPFRSTIVPPFAQAGGAQYSVLGAGVGELSA